MMKNLLFTATLCLSFAATHSAFGIVGYYNVGIYPGDNLIANQLDNGSQSLSSLVFSGSGAVPNGATFTKWNSAVSAFLPLSVYDSSSDTWSINYSLNFGEGGLLSSSSLWVNTFVGTVLNYTNVLSVPGPALGWHPNYSDGLHLIASPSPIGGSISSLFEKIVDRAPEDGEWVKILNPATQTYTLTTFHTGSGWDNGDPTLNVGQSAWFNLGPVNVPEPSTLALGLTAMAFCFARRRSR